MEQNPREQRAGSVARWLGRLVPAAGILVVAWVLITAWGAVVHGHPLYLVLLVVTLVSSAVGLWRSIARDRRRTGWRLAGWAVLLTLAAGWIIALAWLRPFTAEEPALTAMASDDTVTVTETATLIVMTPTRDANDTGLFFQPGARVEARAYAAVLRPQAEAGHVVVIEKQPLGIAFLSLGALDDARSAAPDVNRWVVGGHSLGGTVAAMQADSDEDPDSPVAGLLLYASYPAGDVSGSLDMPVLSLSADLDGLATPGKIQASQSDLPEDADLQVIAGASHAQFGDYGTQPGDGIPTITDDAARAEIAAATSRFLSDGLR